MAAMKNPAFNNMGSANPVGNAPPDLRANSCRLGRIGNRV
jgi:hypothetical protein